MTTMRAKMRVSNVEKFDTGERLTFDAVGSDKAYPADGSSDDNTYAKFTPSAQLTMYVNNPVLMGVIQPGEKYYLDFTKAAE